VRIELITDVDRLDAFAAAWDTLCDDASRPSSTSGLLIGWYRFRMTEGSLPHVWVIWDADELIGIVPMVSTQMVGGGQQILPAGSGMIFGVYPVIAPGWEEAVATAVAHEIYEPGQRVNMIRLDALVESSPWFRVLGATLSAPEWESVQLRRDDAPFIDLSEGYEAWFRARQSSFRSSARRRRRRLTEAGLVDVSTGDPDALASYVPAIQRVYNARSAQSGEERYRLEDSFSSALTEAVRRSEAGRFYLTGLEHDGQLQAFTLCVQAGRWSTGWLTGFDGAFGALGPGKETMMMGMNEIAGSTDFVDLGVGGHSYKEEMKSGDRVLLTSAWCRRRYRRLMFAFAPDL
jgi:CelD/BcsL family acetyltransferase involved in cellulose biosynthesis